MFKGRECYLHADPTHIYDLVSWDPISKLYTLKNDLGTVVHVHHYEFTPMSLRHEDLVRCDETGNIVPADEAMEQNLRIRHQAAFECSPSQGQPGAASGPPKARKAQGQPKGDSSGAKAEVRERLAGATSREEIAKAAGEILNEDPAALIAKYAHLDNGRFRMVLGNRMVGTLNKATK